jgi:hypothetical protein
MRYGSAATSRAIIGLAIVLATATQPACGRDTLPAEFLGRWDYTGSSGGITGSASSAGEPAFIVINSDNTLEDHNADGTRIRTAPFTVARASTIYSRLPDGPQTQEPRPEDVATIDGIIRAYYEVVSGPAGEAADAARDRTLHHPDAWVAIAGTDSAGAPVVRVVTLAEYHGTNPPRGAGFFEYETDRVVSRSGSMAHVWSSYASARTPDGEPFARGVNSITLFHDGRRWWIMGWMFDSSAG